MKNFTFTTLFKTLFLCCLGLFLANCEGEDGAVGPDGENGVNATDGTNGTDGSNGENAVGYDEMIKYGNIHLTITGEDPNGNAFTDAKIFKFTAQDAEYNSYDQYENTAQFYPTRFLSIPGEKYQQSTASFNLIVDNLGDENESLRRFSFNINQYFVLTEDLNTFGVHYRNFPPLNLPFDNDAPNPYGIKNLSIINYSFNDETNNLKFSFSYSVDGDTNSTGKEITITGEVDVIVFKNLFPRP